MSNSTSSSESSDDNAYESSPMRFDITTQHGDDETQTIKADDFPTQFFSLSNSVSTPSIATPSSSSRTPSFPTSSYCNWNPESIKPYAQNITFDFTPSALPPTKPTKKPKSAVKKETRKKAVSATEKKKVRPTLVAAFLQPPSPKTGKLSNFGFAIIEKKKEIQYDSADDFVQQSHRQRAVFKAKLEAHNIRQTARKLTPTFPRISAPREPPKDNDRKPAAKPEPIKATKVEEIGGKNELTRTHSSPQEVICRHCKQPMNACDDAVYGAYCIQYVHCYYKSHYSTMNTHMIEKQFRIAAGHAKIVNLFTTTNTVEHTYDPSVSLPLCMLDGSYIKTLQLISMQQRMNEVMRRLQNGDDIDVNEYLRGDGKEN